MKRTLLIGLFLAAGVSNMAMANADLAKAKNCMACHSVNNKVLGPAFKDIGAKYAGQKGAEDKLVQKVMKGGSGVWGTVPMPANARQRLVGSVQRALAEIDVEGLKVPSVREGTVGIHARAMGGASLPLSERFLVGATAPAKGF